MGNLQLAGWDLEEKEKEKEKEQTWLFLYKLCWTCLRFFHKHLLSKSHRAHEYVDAFNLHSYILTDTIFVVGLHCMQHNRTQTLQIELTSWNTNGFEFWSRTLRKRGHFSFILDGRQGNERSPNVQAGRTCEFATSLLKPEAWLIKRISAQRVTTRILGCIGDWVQHLREQHN
jgi:hypothetical protein